MAFRAGSVSFILTCPICSKNKLYVRKQDGRSICFHCQDDMKGWADRVLARVLNVPWQELAEVLYGVKATAGTGLFDVDIFDYYPEDFGLETDSEILDLPEVYWPWHAYTLEHPMAEPGVEYLTRRGVSIPLAMRYDIRYLSQERRVGFPVTQEGRMVGYQARTILADTKAPKMLTVGKVGGKALMFDQNLNPDYAILAEGPFDALKCCLLKGWVASMGKGVTEQQIRLILKHAPKRLYLALDPDAASEVTRLIKTAGQQTELYKLDPLPGYKDLGEMTPQEVEYAWENSRPIAPGQLFVFLK